LHDHGKLHVLAGRDGKQGWLSSTLGKTQLYDAAADAFREHETTLHSFGTFTQLSLVEGSSLRAPEGEHDDRADSYALAVVACRIRAPSYRMPDDWSPVLWPIPERLRGGTPAGSTDNSGGLVDDRTRLIRQMLQEDDDGDGWHHDLVHGPLR
jgi:hypothetical protein